MKLGLLLLVVAVLLGGLVGTLVVRDPGYVLVAYDDMALETSLWFAVVLLIGAYFAVRLAVYLFVRVAASGPRLGDWNRDRKAKKARQQTVRGLLLMAERNWVEARKLLVAAAGEVSSPLINYLNAARAAHEMGDAEGRDDLLRMAHESTPGARFAVGLTQAELQMAGGQWEQCLATLLQLRAESARHPQVLSMLAQCHERLQDWQALIELIPAMRRAKCDRPEALAALQRRAWSGRLEAAGDDLQEVWKRVPKEHKRNAELVARYAERLAAEGGSQQAEAAVRRALEQNWHADLVDLYGKIISADAQRQLVVAEGWLKERPNDSNLLLALGRICLMNQQWAKAREYFEASLRLKRSPEVYGELGRLCSALGDLERGSEYLAQSLGGLPPLPLPEPGAEEPEALGA